MKTTRSQLSANPIFVRLCGPLHRWSPPALVLFLVAAASIVTAEMAPHVPRGPAQGQASEREMLAGWLVVFIAPAILAVIVMVFVGRDARGEAYQLLRLTNLSARDRVRGYVAAAYYRMRFLLIALVVLLSPLASRMILDLLVMRAFNFYCPVNDVRCSSFGIYKTPQLAFMAAATVLHLMIWGLVVLAITSGVLFGIRWRNNLPLASLVAVSLLLLSGIMILMWRLWLHGFPFAHVGICAGLFGLSFGLSHLAERWA